MVSSASSPTSVNDCTSPESPSSWNSSTCSGVATWMASTVPDVSAWVRVCVSESTRNSMASRYGSPPRQ
jgi:hypothetical protein